MTMTLPGWLVILAEQAIIVLLLLSVVFYLRSRKLKRLLREVRASGDTTSVPAGTAEPPPPSQAPTPAQTPAADLHVWEERLERAQQRIKNLEQFRDMFFDLKNRIGGLLDSQETMYGHMRDAGLPLQEQQALQSAFEKLQKEKEQLEQHLAQVDAELEVLLSDRHKPGDGAQQESDAEIMQNQQAEIARLIQEIADLTVESSGGTRLQSTIKELTQRSGELAVAVEILQDENQFLSDQIQTLLQQQNDKDRRQQKESNTLAQQLAKLQEEHDSLSEKHLRLESEYLKLQ